MKPPHALPAFDFREERAVGLQCRATDPYYDTRDVGPLAYATAPRRFFVSNDCHGANGRVIHLRTLGAVDL
ncbi:MAG TPA: hypothetical protein VK511_10225, partial [Gemmatimonadaceae bacterium]|nr:hypothetical protein [Gemmatimonadaceae bacterium]